MKSILKFFLLVSIVLPISLQFELEGQYGYPNHDAFPYNPQNSYRPPNYYPNYINPRFQDFQMRADYRPDYPETFRSYSPPQPERRLDEMPNQPMQKTINDPILEKNTNLTWWKAPQIVHEIPPVSADRNLEVKPIMFKKEREIRKLGQLNARQKALAVSFKKFIQKLKTHQHKTLEQDKILFKTQFSKDIEFFESNFWKIIESNYDVKNQNHLKINLIENQIAKKIFDLDLSNVNLSFFKKNIQKGHKMSFVSPLQISNFFNELAIEREVSTDGTDSLNGFQLRDDFETKFKLLRAVYEAENELFKNHDHKKQVISRLKPFKINTYNEFKTTTFNTLEYFVTILNQYKIHKRNIQNRSFITIMRNVQIMIKTIRNKILGLFFYKYINRYEDLKIKRNNPTLNQKQTLKLEITKLIEEIGIEKYSSTVYRIIKQVKSFDFLKDQDLSQEPSSFPIFQQIFQNQIKSGSLRFLLSYFFQNFADKATNIENFIFMNNSKLSFLVKFDFRRFLIDLINNYNIKSFQEFNLAVTTLSKQVEIIFKKAPSSPTKTYFDQFITIYSKITFQILGKYFYLIKKPDVFAEYARTYKINRDYYPENYYLLTGNHDKNTIVYPKRKTDLSQEMQKIIFDLSHYLENPNGLIFNSEIERQNVLKLINQILNKGVSPVLSQKSFKIVNQLKEKIQEMSKPSLKVLQKVENIDSGIENDLVKFKFRLNAGFAFKPKAISNFKISIKFLENSAVITKLLISIFKHNTEKENSLFLKLTNPFLDVHVIPHEVDEQLDHIYSASDIYVGHYEDKFNVKDLPQAVKLWKVLMRFYSRECHIELYKILTTKINFLTNKQNFEKSRFKMVKMWIINLFLFLSKNQNFDLKKDCDQVAKMIVKNKFLSQNILKRTFLINSFKKIFLKVGKGQTIRKKIGYLLQRENGASKYSINHHQNVIGAEVYPSIPVPGKRIDRPETPPDDTPDNPLNKFIILILQKYLLVYGLGIAPPDNFDWKGIFKFFEKNDFDLFFGLFKLYLKDPSKIELEKNLEIIMKIKAILIKIFAPPKQQEPPKNTTNIESLQYASSMMQAFYRTYAEKNQIPISHKKIKFKVPTQIMSYFIQLSKKYPQSAPVDILKGHPRIFNKLQKVLFFSKPIEKNNGPTQESFSNFSKHVLFNYFNDRLKKGFTKPQFLAKVLFKPNNPELKSYLKVLYKKTNKIPPIEPPTNITEIIKNSEFKFYNKLIHLFDKNTNFLRFHPNAKKINARVFFKYLPKPKLSFLHRIYKKYGRVPVFMKKGPVEKVQGLIQRVQFKAVKKCQSKCVSKCYKIVDGVKTELTEEEKKEYKADFPCNENSVGLKLFDLNGNIVTSGEMALYGCGCNCGSGNGGVQINEKPTINFNINFENENEASQFEEFLKNSDFLTKIKDTNVIDMERLKEKYKTSKIDGIFDIDLLHKKAINIENFDENGNNYQLDDDKNFLSPKSLGMSHLIDDSGVQIGDRAKFVLNGENYNFNEKSVKTPVMFGIKESGEIENIEDYGANQNGKETFTILQKPRTFNMPRDQGYPLFYHVPKHVVAENLDDDELERANELQQTLKSRFPLNQSRYPYNNRYVSPYSMNRKLEENHILLDRNII